MSVFRWMKTDWHHFAHKTLELLTINTIHIMNDAGKWTHIAMLCCCAAVHCHQHETIAHFTFTIPKSTHFKTISIVIVIVTVIGELPFAIIPSLDFAYLQLELLSPLFIGLKTAKCYRICCWSTRKMVGSSFGQHSVDRIIDFAQWIFMIQFLAV